jgi:hypothetical protein
MPTATRQRTVRLTRTAGGLALVIRQQTAAGLKVEAYYLTRVEGGLMLTKPDGTIYTVRGAGASCDCPARLHGSKVVCRHRAAVQTLVARGKLPQTGEEVTS